MKTKTLATAAGIAIAGTMLFSQPAAKNEDGPLLMRDESKIMTYIAERDYKEDIKRLYDAARGYFKNGRWEIRRMESLQKDYNRILRRYGKYETVDGIPESVIELLPMVKEISNAYGVDPYLTAGIITAESYGNVYAVHISHRRKTEESLGLMQVNTYAHQLPPELMQKIFEPSFNVMIGTSIVKSCLKKAGGNERMAARFFNKGENVANSPRIAMRDSYAKRVMEYREKFMRLDSGGSISATE